MKKYEICETSKSFSWRNRRSIRSGCTSDCMIIETIESFESLEKAQEVFNEKFKVAQVQWDCYNKLYYVEEFELWVVDNDGDDVDIPEVSEMVIEVYDEDGECVATFDSYAEAEDFIKYDDRELKLRV